MSDIRTILQRCEIVWRQQAVSEAAIFEMRAELESHLREAQAAGKTADSVIGEDADAFARHWAHANAPRNAAPLLRDVAPSARTIAARKTRQRLWLSLVAIVVFTAIALVVSPRGGIDDIEPWQWGFVLAFFVLLMGELLSGGGFFVLPFAIGALCAAILSFADIDPPALIVVFIVTSALAMWSLREYASKDDDVIVNVGANRYIERQAVVTEAINGATGVGRVRLDTESWLAVSDENFWFEPGTVVKVTKVRGARLVVTAT